jgi:hypothetical protein
MELKVGSRVKLESESVARPARTGVIEEVVREAPSPCYRVRCDDGHESIYTPAAGRCILPSRPRRHRTTGSGRRDDSANARGAGQSAASGLPADLAPARAPMGGSVAARRWSGGARSAALLRLPQSSAGHAPVPGRRPTRSPAVHRAPRRQGRARETDHRRSPARPGAIGGAIARQCERRLAPERPCQQPPLPPRSDVRIACPVRHPFGRSVRTELCARNLKKGAR